MSGESETFEDLTGIESAGTPAEGSEGVESASSALIRERDELKDKLLRAQAEAMNVAKRMRTEHSNSLRHASVGFAKAMLPVLDGLERTIKSIDEAGRDDPIATGVKLLREEFIKGLRSHGVEPIESVGKPFDPELHEALMQDAKSNLPAGTVTTEFERGYRLHDRVLRHAKVVVSAKPDEEKTDSEGDSIAN